MRLDQYLLEHHGLQTRSRAQRMIKAGHVEVQTRAHPQFKPVLKPAFEFDPETMQVRLSEMEELRWVSRGALKLLGALEQLSLSVHGMNCLDVGLSTGGFSEVLLDRGAELVCGIDVGQEQLHARLKTHPKLVWWDKVHAAKDPWPDFPVAQFDLVVMDVSFISITQILPRLSALLAPGGSILSLVKPQFELGKKALNKSGVVKDPTQYQGLEDQLKLFSVENGYIVLDYFGSSVKGGDGNNEFFIQLSRA